MKKVFFLSAIAALALSSCSSDETLQAPVQQDGAIAFDIYTGRAVNRAVPTKDFMMKKNDRQNITTPILEASWDGFGVFAYETGAQKFQSYLANNTYPTYMFNQQVQYDKDLTGTVSNWVYTPVKYWPNDDSNVTFQAYAPWTESTENVLFDVKYNGVGIRYALDLAFEKIRTNNYDLLWGENKGTQKCFYDQTKPGIADKTMFHFQHALSKVDFTVSYNADDMDCDTPKGLLDENTEIVIRSIKLLGTLPSQGVLSLYDGSWTVEKVVENKFEFDTDFFGYTKAIGTSNKTLTGAGFEPEKATRPGVLDKDVQKLYANSSVMLIPAKSPVKLEISYDVVTKAWTDPVTGDVFPGHTKNITIVSDNLPDYWGDTHHDAGNGDGIFTFAAGMWTTINIHLGMTSVKLDADVEPWDQSESGSIDMPANAETPVVHFHQNIEDAIAAGTLFVENMVVKHIPFYTLPSAKKPNEKLCPDGFYLLNGSWHKYKDGAEVSPCPPVNTFDNITDGKMTKNGVDALDTGLWYITNIPEGPSLFEVTDH